MTSSWWRLTQPATVRTKNRSADGMTGAYAGRPHPRGLFSQRFAILGCLFAPYADDERAALHTVFPAIFEDQLNGWWQDRTTWPTPPSFGTFTNWFDCQFHSTLLDLVDEPLTEEHV